MQFKLFAPGESPDKSFRTGLDVFLRLDESQRQKIARWFLTTDNFEPEDSISSPEIAASSLLPEQFVAVAEVVGYILEAWYRYDLQADDVRRDLLLLNYSSAQIETIAQFLGPLSEIKDRVFAERARHIHEDAVLPTVEDVNFALDLRAVFEDPAYPPPERAKMVHTKLLTFRPAVLMEILTSDFFHRKQKLSFQMNEQEFNDLFEGMRRAHEQLAELKSKAAVLIAK